MPATGPDFISLQARDLDASHHVARVRLLSDGLTPREVG